MTPEQARIQAQPRTYLPYTEWPAWRRKFCGIPVSAEEYAAFHRMTTDELRQQRKRFMDLRRQLEANNREFEALRL